MKQYTTLQILTFFQHLKSINNYEIDSKIFEVSKELSICYSICRKYYIKYNKPIDKIIYKQELLNHSELSTIDQTLAIQMFDQDKQYLDQLNNNKKYFLDQFNEFIKTFEFNKFLLQIIENQRDNKAGSIDLANIYIKEYIEKIDREKQEEDEEIIEKEVKDINYKKIFPTSITNYIDELVNNDMFNVNYLTTSILAAISSISGTRYQLKVTNNWIAKPIFWFANVGAPGSKKTPPLSTVLKHINKYDFEFNKYYEELEEDIKKNSHPKQIIVNSFTI